MNRLQAEEHVEKNYSTYFFLLAISVWAATKITGVAVTWLLPINLKAASATIFEVAAIILSWIVPLKWDWYWKKTLEESAKKEE